MNLTTKFSAIFNLFLIPLLATTLLFAGCNKDKDKVSEIKGMDFGEKITNLSELTSISSIVKLPKNFEGKKVTVKGIIASVCPSSGCNLFLGDGADQIKVDLKENGFNVPPGQNAGHIAFVSGTVRVNGDQFKIVGTGVKILEKND